MQGTGRFDIKEGARARGVPSLTKLRWSLPWLVRYPFWAIREWVQRSRDASGSHHLIFIVANHFEPSWNEQHLPTDWATQLSRLERWCKQARGIGRAFHDSDGTPFRHTYFYPGEQYHPPLLEKLAELQAEGLGEVEIHLHHGVEHPDTALNLKRTLEEFRDLLAEEHRCLSRLGGAGKPMYGFVHGNFALANSCGGRFCGVDSEMQILAETGCYADFTLPAVPTQSQVRRINAIYQCGRPLQEKSPHRTGPNLRVQDTPVLPVLFTGPLVFDWSGCWNQLRRPRVEDGVLSANRPPNLNRFRNWRRAGIGIRGKPNWSFIKLYCHGFFEQDQPAMIGECMRRFLDEMLALAERSEEFEVHFATAREAFNIAMAAVDGQTGEPGLYRDYRLRPIMAERPKQQGASDQATLLKTGSFR